MRFIGNKTNLTESIYSALEKKNALSGPRFFDFFAGTASVGKHFRQRGFEVATSDIMYFSYVLQRAYIACDLDASFNGMSDYHDTLKILNALPDRNGFIFYNFTEEGTIEARSPYIRKYFTGPNGQRIDAIRLEIEHWREYGRVTEDEYFILLATLIESVPFFANISGVYAAFLKSYDPRALKPFGLRPIELTKGRIGYVTHANSMDLISALDTDILYLDPPYNARQYAPNYHLLETIARYDDPPLRGITGLRPYSDQKSEFCNAATALAALAKIASDARYTTLALSYNSEGIMPTQRILDVLGRHGEVSLAEFSYRRFKSNSNGHDADKKHVFEQLFILQTQSISRYSRSLPTLVGQKI